MGYSRSLSKDMICISSPLARGIFSMSDCFMQTICLCSLSLTTVTLKDGKLYRFVLNVISKEQYLMATCLEVCRLSSCSNSDLWFLLMDNVNPSVIMSRSTPKWKPVHLHTCRSFTVSTLPHLKLFARNTSSGISLGLEKNYIKIPRCTK